MECAASPTDIQSVVQVCVYKQQGFCEVLFHVTPIKTETRNAWCVYNSACTINYVINKTCDLTRHWLKMDLPDYTISYLKIGKIPPWLASSCLLSHHVSPLFAMPFWSRCHRTQSCLFTSCLQVSGKNRTEASPTVEQRAVFSYTWKWQRPTYIYPTELKLDVSPHQTFLCGAHDLPPMTHTTGRQRRHAEGRLGWKGKESLVQILWKYITVRAHW